MMCLLAVFIAQLTVVNAAHEECQGVCAQQVEDGPTKYDDTRSLLQFAKSTVALRAQSGCDTTTENPEPTVALKQDPKVSSCIGAGCYTTTQMPESIDALKQNPKVYSCIGAGCDTTTQTPELIRALKQDPVSSPELRIISGQSAYCKNLKEPAIGLSAELSQAGFESVVQLCCPLEMMAFIRRVFIAVGDYAICNEGSLAGFAIWFDCPDDGSSYDALVQKAEIEVQRTKAQDKCAWVQKKGVPCHPLPAECGDYPDAVLPPCLAPCSKTNYFNMNLDGAPVSRNLGGQGPDTSSAIHELRFSNVGTLDGKRVDVAVKNLTTFTTFASEKIGRTRHNMGRIAVKAGTKVDLEFRFEHSDTKQLVKPIDEIHLSFLDIDQSQDGGMQEKIYFDQECIVKEESAEFDITKAADGRTMVVATHAGPGCDNPTDPMNLGVSSCTYNGAEWKVDQRKRAAMAVVRKDSKVKVTLEVTCKGGGAECNGGRMFYFVGNCALEDLCRF